MNLHVDRLHFSGRPRGAALGSQAISARAEAGQTEPSPVVCDGLPRLCPLPGAGRFTAAPGGNPNAFDRLAQLVDDHAADHRSADQLEIGSRLGTAGGAIENYSGPASPGGEASVISGPVRCQDDPCGGQVEKLIAPVASAASRGE